MKKVLLIIAGPILLIVTIFSLLELTNTFDLINIAQKQNSEEPVSTNEQKESKETKPTQPHEPQTTTPTPNTSTVTPSNTPATPKIDLEVSLSSSGTYRLFAKAYGVTSGDCTVNIKNGSVESYQTDTIYYDGGEYGSCAGFSERKEKMGAGTWTFDFTLNANGQTYTSTTTYDVP